MYDNIARCAVYVIALIGFLTPTATLAGAHYEYIINDGQGNCAVIACGDNGCAVINTFPCPREVGDENPA